MKLLIFFFLLFITSFNVLSQSNKSLKVFTDCNFFYDPFLGEYVELKFQYDARFLTSFKDKNWFHSKVNVNIQLKLDTVTVINSTYTIVSPKFQDSVLEDFYDVRRFSLIPGKYKLLLSFKDLHSSQAPVVSSQMIEVPNLHSNISISDIQICENIRESKEVTILSKSGYELFPRLINYFPADCKYFPTYFELYNSDKDSLLLKLKTVFYSIDQKKEIEFLTSYSDVFVSQVTPIIHKNDISLLPTGKYRLTYSLWKDSLELSSSSYYFDRTNNLIDYVSSETIVLDPIFQSSISSDSLGYFLSSIIPIANEMEIPVINKILKENDTSKMRRYFQSFWVITAGRLNASSVWINYKSQVKMVENNYSTSIFKGYETDRGRVYLKYGPPNAIAARETSPSEYPYEIWQYDKIKQFSNKRFIFYNPDLVNNHYQLLHSDMQGELKNYRWQQLLTKRNSPNQNIDDPNDGNKDHYGGESENVFKQF